jgi:hypothetical protein
MIYASHGIAAAARSLSRSRKGTVVEGSELRRSEMSNATAFCRTLLGSVCAVAVLLPPLVTGAEPVPPATAVTPNTLTDQERAQGFRLLWDGKTGSGWRGAKSTEFPKEGWAIEDGILTVLETGGRESRAAGDIITTAKFAAFELKLEFRISPGANSGIKYYVDPELNKAEGSAIGLEYQILDDERHPDAKMGRDGNRTIASLYDLIPAAATKKPRPIGEWNEARIVSRGRRVEHWLNGEKVVEYERGSAEYRKLVAESKYKVWPAFGELPEGHILLQDHGNRVSFRSIKLRELKPE